MRQALLLSLAALTALTVAACGKSEPGGQSATGGDPMKAATELAFQFQPGQYRTTIAIQKVDIPGMPPAFAEQMKKAMSKSLSSEHCISAAQAAKGVEAMKQHMGQGRCQFESFNARGGMVDSVFTCSTGPDMQLRSTSTGTYTATGSQVASKAEMKGPAGKTVQIEQTVTTERIGDCAG